MKTNDNLYNNLISDILQNKEFDKISYCAHHGITRMDHSLRVSYYSYKIAKFLKLDYRSVARAGLLHDFFYHKNKNNNDRMKTLFFHSKMAKENSLRNFNLNKVEEDIILTHMFPLTIYYIPRYSESIIVSLVDKVIATYEFYCSFSAKFKYVNNFIFIFLLLGR